jgi:hypothetical protein
MKVVNRGYNRAVYEIGQILKGMQMDDKLDEILEILRRMEARQLEGKARTDVVSGTPEIPSPKG